SAVFSIDLEKFYPSYLSILSGQRLTPNAFYTAICRFSGRLPPSFLSKALSIVALICMKQIEKQYEYVW
ncbi:hypothetical protein R7F09_13505, partial [Vibrio sp. Vb2532]|uniref:hypothetical protein n=1 Tax=Vibrio sp. Vb2532 TaxID=3074666 RepID=UPI002964CF6B